MELVIIAGLGALIWIAVSRVGKRRNGRWKAPAFKLTNQQKQLLARHVNFYAGLNATDKKHFEYEVAEFLTNVQVTGVDVEVEELDHVLIAASAVIPIFHFRTWKYSNLQEVLLYPGAFDQEFNTSGEDRRILGMVGTGYMEGKMILSKNALRLGFSNATDKKNTAIHEFVHLIDKADGAVDGVPQYLLEHQYAIPWMDLMRKKISEIHAGASDINPYGGTNDQEFFAVTSEYFFERPKLLKKNHPQLYQLLSEVFDQNMVARNLSTSSKEVGRNDPCPCGSGLKYKKCCL